MKPRMRIAPALAVSIFAVLGACVPKAAPPPAPSERPRLPPAPPPAPATSTADWRDWPQTPGTWTYIRAGRGTVAAFGEPSQPPLLTLRCDPLARRISIERADAGDAPLTVRTTSMARTLAVQRATAGRPVATATLPAADPLLDAMGFSRGRFTVEQAGSTTLVLPAWAEVERVTQDCRGG